MLKLFLAVYATMSLTAPQTAQPEKTIAEATNPDKTLALLQDREVRQGWYYDYYYPVYPPTKEQQRRARYGEKDRYPSTEDETDRNRYPEQNDESDRQRYPDRSDESDLDRYPTEE